MGNDGLGQQYALGDEHTIAMEGGKASLRVDSRAPDKTAQSRGAIGLRDTEHFSKNDVVFECFHNFVALSQWGHTIIGVMSRLSQDGGAPEVRASFEKIMSGGYDNANGGPYTPLELLVMELFRTISPNGGSLSALEDTRQSQNGDNYGDSRSPYVGFGLPYERHSFMITPHTSTSFDPRHWKNPQQFDPERYRSVPTSTQIDKDKCRQIGFPRCPFDITTFPVSDGRKAG